MKIDINRHKCKKNIEAEWEVRGICPYCENKYDWAWDGELWSDYETCLPIFGSESESIKKHFLMERDYI